MERGEFKGRIGRYHWESEPYWPPEPSAPDGAPNVVIVLLDDVGFAQLGCFGSDISTPTFDRLAAGGLRYTNFHTTALCSPTRACVLTGRNHHSVGMGRIADLATGFPGYDARIPRSAAMLPKLLTRAGYSAYMVGKWHLTPEEEYHLGARRDRWPLGRGFERYYGFFSGETHQSSPALVHDNHFVEPPGDYSTGYHLTEDLADRAIEFVTDLRHADDRKPFFLYFATGACHSPHQAPPEYIERYRGHFDDGWDVWREQTLARQKEMGVVPAHTNLSDRPDWVPAWDSLPQTEKQVYARFMEAFAGFLTHTDAQIGRFVDWLDHLGELENTLVFVMSDNGASSEGGPTGSLNDVRAWNALPRFVDEAAARIDEIGGPRIHNNYPWGWTVAGNTPFRRWKRETHEGGVADPCIVHWPAGIAARGENRRQYVHAIDVVPTVLAAVGIETPTEVDGVEQQPIEGVAMNYSFGDVDAPERHTTQYYEMLGTRAIYHEGWKAVVYHDIQADEPGLDKVGWELYDLAADPSETNDLAEAEPDRLQAMIERWWVEAATYNVLPLDNRPFSEFVLGRPGGTPARSSYTYYPGFATIPEEQAAPTKGGRSHSITAYVTVPDDTDGPMEGAIAVEGSVLGGWSLHVANGRLSYVHNLSGWREYRVDAELAHLEPGEHTLAFHFTAGTQTFSLDASAADAGFGELRVDGETLATVPFKRFTWNRYSLTNHGLTIGRTWGEPPTDDYRSPFVFEGAILDRVVIETDGRDLNDDEVAAAARAEADDQIAMQ